MDERADVGEKKKDIPKEVPPAAPLPIDPPQPPPIPEPEEDEHDDESKRSSSISDKVMVWATCVIAAGTLVSAGAIVLQWREMVNGGQDTKNLVEYARRQADAADKIERSAEKQAGAARQFTDMAGNINGNINAAVGKLGSQATAMEKSASAAEISAQVAQTALQPAIAFGIATTKVSDDSISYEIKITNEGGSSAMVTMRVCSFFDAELKTDVSVDKCKAEIRTDGPFIVLPHHEKSIPRIQPNTAPAKIGQTYLYTPYELSYTYAKIRYTLPNCIVYDKTLNALNDCGAAIRNRNSGQKK